jgi:hypothetical protein
VPPEFKSAVPAERGWERDVARFVMLRERPLTMETRIDSQSDGWHLELGASDDSRTNG